MRFIVLMGLFLFSLLSFASENKLCDVHQCVVVIDAGSSGSRVHLYDFDLQNAQPVSIHEAYVKKITPGVSSMKAKDINQYINDMMSNVPYKNIPVYLYATAGMRMLPVEQQKAILDTVHEWFEQHQEWSLQDAKVISGKEEGILGWLSMQYKQKDPHAGFVEIGGASMQIAFPVDNIEGINKNDVTELDVNGSHMVLFSQCINGLGANEVFTRFQNAVCFPVGYALPDSLYGDGDALSCESLVVQSIGNDYFEQKNAQAALVHNPQNKWYTVGALSGMIRSPVFDFKAEKANPSALISRADSEVCHQNWDLLVKQYPNEGYLKNHCLMASYAYGLFVDMFGIDSHQTISVTQDTDSDWTLGVILRTNH